MANPNLSEIVTTTLRNYSGTIADNVSAHNALLRRIDSKGNKRPATGRDIVQELEYAANSTVKWYSGYETLDVSPSDVLSAATFSWKQLAGAISISGLEQLQNSGSEAIHSLIRARTLNLERSLANTLATALYADGTGNDAKEVGGLQLLVADDPTSGTVGSINRASQTFWRNQIYDFSVSAATASSGNIQEGMNSLWLACIRGSDVPDAIVADDVYFKHYWTSLQAIQRITNDNDASAGFMNLKYMNADCYYDDQAPASHMYFLNTDYLFMRTHPNREFVPLEERASINQDAIVVPTVWAGNMSLSNSSLQGVMHV